MKKKDIWVIVAVVVLALVVFGLSKLMPRMAAVTGDGAIPQQTATAGPAGTDAPVAAHPTLPPAKSYLLVQVDRVVYDPYPITEEKDLELLQKDGKRNVVHLIPDEMKMQSANCDNQDCIHQGMVSLENRDKRVLNNQIICLPNKVILSLIDADEAQKLWDESYGQR